MCFCVLSTKTYPLLYSFPVPSAHRAHEDAQGVPEEERLRIIALTAMSLADVRDRALEVGMQDFLHKPFSTETLIEKLANNPQVEG